MATRQELLVRTAGRRVPIDPLLELDCISEMARATGTNPRQWYEWRRVGVLVDRADALAVALGHHPAELWLDWYADELEEASE